MGRRVWATAGAVLVCWGLIGGTDAVQAAPARPMPVSVEQVRVAPAGVDQVRVTWRGGTRTTGYAFIAGSTSMTDRNHFESGWFPPNDAGVRARSVLLTVPQQLRSVLGGGSGNYVFVKVVQTNSPNRPPKCRSWSPATWCRASPSGSAALAGSATDPAASFPLRVASWNVQSVTATQDAALEQQWAQRLPKVARTVLATAPQVLGTQESTTARLDPTCLNRQGAATTEPCPEQYMSLAAALGPSYVNAGGDAWQWCYRQAARHQQDRDYRGYVDSSIYVQTASIEVLGHGFISPADDLALPAFRSNDEAGAWALLRDRGSGARFLAASMHLPVGDAAATLRVTETAALGRWLVAKSAAVGHVPVLLLGDLNSYAGTDLQPAVTPLRALGFSDAAAAASRSNARWSSTNVSNSSSESTGYPVDAVLHPYPTNRIDYVLIFTSASSGATSYATRYDNVVRLTADGRRFDPAFQGSDHDLQLAQLRLPSS